MKRSAGAPDARRIKDLPAETQTMTLGIGRDGVRSIELAHAAAEISPAQGDNQTVDLRYLGTMC